MLQGPEETEPVGGWLTPDELTSWLAVVKLLMQLPWAIDAQLQNDSGLSMTEYQVMAMLAEEDDHRLRMNELAQMTSTSSSRLSHLAKRLESRGWIRRERDVDDGRFINAFLTDEGLTALVRAAPGHVENVRRLVIDALTPEQLRRLAANSERITRRIGAPPR